MERVAIVGASGSGKTTLAHRLAAIHGLSVIDLDRLYHRPGWAPTPTPEFRRIVAEALAEAGRWAVAGNYAVVADLVHGSADAIVWIDLPRTRSTWRVARRSARRVATRAELWNGNRERLADVVSWDPERNPIRWTWVTHDDLRRRYASLADTPLWRNKPVYRLRTVRDVDALVSLETSAVHRPQPNEL